MHQLAITLKNGEVPIFRQIAGDDAIEGGEVRHAFASHLATAGVPARTIRN